MGAKVYYFLYTFFQRFFCIYIPFCNYNYNICLVLIKIMNIFIQYISDPFIVNIEPSFVGLQMYFSWFLSEYLLIIFFIWENVCILRICLYPAYINNRSLSIKRILHSKLCPSKKQIKTKHLLHNIPLNQSAWWLSEELQGQLVLFFIRCILSLKFKNL